MSSTSALKTVRNLKMFNRLNKSIKQGITDMQNKDQQSAENYFKLASKTAFKLAEVAEEEYKTHFEKIIAGLDTYFKEKNEQIVISTQPSSVHSQLWAVHKKICDNLDIPYVEDTDEMEAAISKLTAEGAIS